MKNLIFLILITLGIYACSKKDDPKPSTSTGCAKVYTKLINSSYTGTDSLNVSIQYDGGIPTHELYKNTLNYDGTAFRFNNRCYPSGSNVKFTLWSKDSSYFKVVTIYCPPNDTVTYTVSN